MARADSTIRVNVLGDASSLKRELGKSDQAVSGYGKSVAKVGAVIAGAFAVDAVLDFAQTALGEADRIGDATLRLREQLGPLSGDVIDLAGNFEELGQSRQDILELQARMADLGTAAGIADEKLAPAVTTVSEAAAALALIGDADAATFVDLIGKAASGATKPLKELGINLDESEVAARALRDTGKETTDQLTDGELATARLNIIMEKLAPRVEAVTGAEADLEVRQATLDAKFETFTGHVGEALEGPLTDLLTWLLDTGAAADAGAKALRGMDTMIDNIGGSAQETIDDIRELLAVIGRVAGFFPGGAGASFAANVIGTGGGGSRPQNHAPHPGVTVQVQGGSPEEIERAVVKAVNSVTGRSGV